MSTTQRSDQTDKLTAAMKALELRLPDQPADLDQDEEWFEVNIDGSWTRFNVHDYDRIFKIPGLYEAIVYDRLRCTSPRRVVDQLAQTLEDWPTKPSDLRVLDLGAGNGIVAEELRNVGVKRIIGADILPEAAEAAERDRPDVYEAYVVGDITDLNEKQQNALREADLNCLVTVAALGFNDIPPQAFASAFNYLGKPGWASFTLKEDFVTDQHSGFARLIRDMVRERIIDVQAVRRYCHRRSVGGRNLFYVAMTARKLRDVPQALIDQASAPAAANDESDSEGMTVCDYIGRNES